MTQEKPRSSAGPSPAHGTGRSRRGWVIPLIAVIALAAAGAATYKFLPWQDWRDKSRPSGQMTLAVGTFANNGNAPEYVMDVYNDLLYSGLNETNKFKLVERNRMQDIEKEFKRFEPAAKANAALTSMTASSGSLADLMRNPNAMAQLARVNKDDSELVRIRTLTKAQYFLVGVVSDFYAEQAAGQTDSIGKKGRRSALSITVEARLVNTETGEIIAAPSVCIEEPKVTGTAGNALADRLEKLKIEVARKAAQKVARLAVQGLYPITVSEVANGKVYLNQGSGMGVANGDLFTVYSQGAPIVDPDTKKTIGHVEESVGNVVVSEAMDKMSVATPVSEGGAIKKGMLCRASATASSDKADKPGLAPRDDDSRMSIAILPLRNSGKADQKVVDDLQTYFYTELGRYPNVRLIERQQFEALEKELGLKDDGYVSPDSAVQIGKLTGAKYCLIGSLVRLDQKATNSTLREGLTMTQNGASVELDCRILETSKGEIYDGRTATSSSVKEQEADASEVASAAMREAVKDTCQQLMRVNLAAAQPEQEAPAAPKPAPAETAKDPGSGPAGAFLVVSAFGKPTEDNAPERLLQLLDSSLQTALAQTKRIPLVERQDDRSLDELVFAQNAKGFVDPDKIPKKGRMVGAKFYLATRVVRYAATASGEKGALPNVYENKWDVTIEVTAKLLNVETGEILEAFQFEKSDAGQSKDRARIEEVPDLLGAHSRVAKDIAQELTKQTIFALFPVVIADVSEKDIYLNQGESTGLTAGMQFAVYELGKDITDPVTGKKIGKRENRAGEIAVVRLNRESAIAAPVAPAEIASFQRGMLCKTERAVSTGTVNRSAGAEPAATADPKTPRADSPPSMKENVYTLAPLSNSAKAPRRVEVAIQKSLSSQIGKTNEIVTSDIEELKAIGEKFLQSKSDMMDEATRLKAVKLTGARYIVFQEITDWVSRIRTDKVPMTKQTIDIQEVNITLAGSVIDLTNGKVLASANVTAASPRDALVPDGGQGDLNMEVTVAQEAADKFFASMKDDGAFGKRGAGK